MTVFLSGGCAGSVPTGCSDKYEEFAADWKQSRTRRPGAPRSLSGSVAIGRSLIKGLKLVNSLVNAASGNAGGGQTFGSGGGQGFVPDSNSGTSGFDAANFWTPIQSAASDPVQ